MITIKQLLISLIEQAPTRSIDDGLVYIYSDKDDDGIDTDGYEIVNISNECSNDSIFIKIKKRE